MAESSALQICPLIQRILPLRNQVTMLASQPFKFCLVDIIENKKKTEQRLLLISGSCVFNF